MSKEPIRRFTLLVLLQAQQDRASELVVDASAGQGSGIRYRVDGTLYEISPPPPHLIPQVVAELGRLANLPEGPFPKEGRIELPFGAVRLKWKLAVAGPDSPCVLTRIET